MWKFDGHDVRRLRRAVKDAKQGRYCKRLMTVLMVAQGNCTGKVAQLTGQARRTVSLLVGRYARRHRPWDLADRPRNGRPRVTPELTASRLKREYARDPLALGYMATEWTVPLLAGHLRRQCGLPVTPRTLRRRMKALGLVWKRPRYVYHPADPHRPQKKGRWFAV